MWAVNPTETGSHHRVVRAEQVQRQDLCSRSAPATNDRRVALRQHAQVLSWTNFAGRLVGYSANGANRMAAAKAP